MLFSPLDRAKAGMKIYITDKEHVYTYVITSVETVTPDRTDLIEDTEGVTEITLVTCEDAAATNRTIVKGTLEGSVSMKRLLRKFLNLSVSPIIKCRFKDKKLKNFTPKVRKNSNFWSFFSKILF